MSKPKPMFERIALIGIGLIGSSISHASRRAGLAKEIVGSARTPATVATAMQLGLIEQGFVTAAEAVEGADLVILCTPVGLCGAIAKEISRNLKPGAALTVRADGIDARFALPRRAGPILACIDGRRSLREIHAEMAKSEGSPLDWHAFLDEFGRLYAVFNGVNKMFLQRGVS